MGFLSTVTSWLSRGASAPVQKGFNDMGGDVFGGGWSPNLGATGGSVSLKTRSVLNKSLSPIECFELSVSVRRAVDAIARNASQAKPRLFTKSGREITGGPLFDIINRPYPLTMWEDWAYRYYAFSCVNGEGAAWLTREGDGGLPTAMRLLNSLRLTIKSPINPDERQDVASWEYMLPSGRKPTIPDTRLLFDPSFSPNPDCPIRGLSPLTTAATHAEIGHFSSLYNKAFFQNDAKPGGMLVLPEGTPAAERKDVEAKWLSRHQSGHYRQSWHKTAVVSGGKELRYEPLDQTFQDGAFMDAQKYSDEKIGQAFGVPPIEMHNLAKTRFDTADDERRMFAETTIAYHLGRLQRAIQTQVIDPYFLVSDFSTEKPTMSKSLEARFEKARGTGGAGSVVLLLDADTMPIMVAVRASIIESAKSFRETTMASPDATNRYFNIELDDPDNDDIRKEVWAQNNIACLSDPSRNAELVPGIKPGAEGGGKPGEPPAKPDAKKPAPKKELTEDDRRRKQALKSAVHKLRVLTLKRMAADEQLWTNAETDGLSGGDKQLDAAIREARFHVRRIVRENAGKDAQIAAVKAYFDSLDSAYLKKTLGL